MPQRRGKLPSFSARQHRQEQEQEPNPLIQQLGTDPDLDCAEDTEGRADRGEDLQRRGMRETRAKREERDRRALRDPIPDPVPERERRGRRKANNGAEWGRARSTSESGTAAKKDRTNKGKKSPGRWLDPPTQACGDHADQADVS